MTNEEKIKDLIEKQKELTNEFITRQSEFLRTIKELELEVKKPVYEQRFWMPNCHDNYLHIDLKGKTNVSVNNNLMFNIDHLTSANCYKVSEKELAEKDAAKMRARQIIQRVADKLHGYRYEFVEDRFNNHVRYMNVYLSCAESTKNNTGNVYFESVEIAQKCLDLCEKEYEILLDMKGE